MTDTTVQHTEIADGELDRIVAELTLDEKVLLLTGRDFWSTHPLERIGLRSMVLSDGPSGVRGATWDERSPSLNLPSASALSASWDPSVARRYGAVAAAEARRKGIDVVLGPTINLHRSPRGGRHFEAFSEDPVLTSDLAVAYVRGLQDNGVAATPKHYVANDFETDRFTADVVVGDRALRELYLLAFERSIVEARAWLVMSAYNSINGVTATENDLLATPLTTEWGFDGVVVSDWTAVRSVASASAHQDLEMPGPVGAWGDALVAAVRDGRVAESAIDEKVRRILRLADRVGALGDSRPRPLVDLEDGRAFIREAAVEGMVLVRNSGELPWNAESVRSVAVIGNNAEHVRTQGGGSATVVPSSVVSPLDGIRAALPGADVGYHLGAITQIGLAGIPAAAMVNPVTGAAGARVRFLAADGAELHAEDRLSTELVWFGGDAPVAASDRVEVEFTLVPARTETVGLGFAATGHGILAVDGATVLDAVTEVEGTDLGAAFLAPPVRSTPIDLVAGEPRRVTFTYSARGLPAALSGALSMTVGTQPVEGDPQDLIAEAVAAAAAADVALVVVGTNAKVESEGFDRVDLRLPGHQDALVSAVAAANPRTVVVVNAGSPVEMPWRDEVAAVVIGWFGGQEFGSALADVLTGAREPGGRLPTTWPAVEADVPVLDTTPVDGTVRYDEGIHIGYRAWLRHDVAPAYPFGFGLGYTTFQIDGVEAPPTVVAGAHAEVVAVVRNTGDRAGKVVVQVYAERPDSAVERPVRWLVASAVARLGAGESARLPIDVPTRLLATWDDGWVYEPGDYKLRVGTSVLDLPADTDIRLEA